MCVNTAVSIQAYVQQGFTELISLLCWLIGQSLSHVVPSQTKQKAATAR